MALPPSSSIINDKYYTDFVPTNSAQAIQKACAHLYCYEDIVVKGRLGNGYFASVFLVEHRPTNQLMAMKLTNEASVQRREIELLSSLNHENVLRLYGTCVIGARFVCLTEFANGGSLAELISVNSSPLSWTARAQLALDILRGLHHLHCHNLVHRDLSSANILIRVTLRPTITTNESSTIALFANQLSSSSLSCDPSDNAENGSDLSISGMEFLAHCLATRWSFSNSELTTPPDGFRAVDTSSRSIPNRNNLMTVTTIGEVGNGRSLSIDAYASTNMPKPFIGGLHSLPTVEPLWKQIPWFTPYNVDSRQGVKPCFTALVADLGLCLDLSQEHADVTSIVGNPYYVAPECLNRVAPYTLSSDVFSFGLLVCELILWLVNDGVHIPRKHEFGLDYENLPVPPTCPPWLAQLAFDSCCMDHTIRPTTSTLVSHVTALLSDMLEQN